MRGHGSFKGDGLACSVQPSSYGCMWVVVMCEIACELLEFELV